MNAPVDQFVLDASVTLAWLLKDEQDDYADRIAARFPSVEMFVPSVWHLEVANALLVAERRGRSIPSDTADSLNDLRALPIRQDNLTVAQAWTATLDLARDKGLSVYDAAYLELAIRTGFPIATLDKPLILAARAAGVRYTSAEVGQHPDSVSSARGLRSSP